MSAQSANCNVCCIKTKKHAPTILSVDLAHFNQMAVVNIARPLLTELYLPGNGSFAKSTKDTRQLISVIAAPSKNTTAT